MYEPEYVFDIICPIICAFLSTILQQKLQKTFYVTVKTQGLEILTLLLKERLYYHGKEKEGCELNLPSFL
jgi:hypothetical protein